MNANNSTKLFEFLNLPYPDPSFRLLSVSPNKEAVIAYTKIYIKKYVVNLLIKYSVYRKIQNKFKDSDDDSSITKILGILDEFLKTNP